MWLPDPGLERAEDKSKLSQCELDTIHPLRKHLLVYYNFDEGGGETAHNKIKKHGNASAYSGATFTPDGIYSDGDNECFTMPTNTWMPNNGTMVLTFRFVAEPAGATYLYLIYSNNFNKWALYFTTNNHYGRLNIFQTSYKAFTYPADLFDGLWHTIVVTYKYNTVGGGKVFIDGKYESSVDTSTYTPASDIYAINGRDDSTLRSSGCVMGMYAHLDIVLPDAAAAELSGNPHQLTVPK